MTKRDASRLEAESFEATRRQLAELHAAIEAELAGLRGRIADLQRHEQTALRIGAQAREVLAAAAAAPSVERKD